MKKIISNRFFKTLILMVADGKAPTSPVQAFDMEKQAKPGEGFTLQQGKGIGLSPPSELNEAWS